MECIVLAGGLGTRLKNHVNNLPKCMAPINEKPFLYYLLRYLEKQKISHVIFSLGYKHGVVEKWVNGRKLSFKSTFIIEEDPLGTGGAIKMALKQSQEKNVFIINGDTFFNVNLKQLYNAQIDYNADLTLALKPMKEFKRYGTVIVDKNKRIISFNEKEYCQQGLINGGIYIINAEQNTLSEFPEKFSFEKEYLQKMVAAKRFYGYICSNYFIDIGIPKDYEKAKNDFKKII